MSTQPHIVIIGGGFGGLYAAKSLGDTPACVTLVDKRNFHLFQPLLYQVATGSLSPDDIASPLRFVLRRYDNITVVLAEVVDIDAEQRQLMLRDGVLAYDMLIVAAGSQYAYFGHDDWQDLAPNLKTIEDAEEMRRRIFFAYEAAEREMETERRQSWMTFVVVGAGPTGVELAGALGELARYTLKENFAHFDPADTRVILVEGLDRVLPPFPPQLSAKALQSLTKRGVTVRTNTFVTEVSRDHVIITRDEEEERISCRTVLWAAGVQGSPLGQALHASMGVELDKVGRVIVQPDLSLPRHPEIFVIGDLAHFAHQRDNPLPGLASVAMQQGKHAAKVIQRRLRGQATEPFHYVDRGTMATIGRAAAVADLGRFKLGGAFAWLIWLFVHLMYLVEFENRLLVLIKWAWNYVTYKRSARLITGDTALRQYAPPPSRENAERQG